MQYGKIIDGKLQYAGQIIKNKNGGTISNPTEKDYVENGWKKVYVSEKEEIDTTNFKYEPLYIANEEQINVGWQIVELTEEEKRNVIINKVNTLEKQYNMCRWQRELILSENSGASNYTKDKAQKIENLANSLRNNINSEEQ